MKGILARGDGFTLIEIAIVIITLAILATAAMTRMQETVQTARFENTKAELDFLARAIAGNPDVYTAGARSDFGYVGDIGALPPSLDHLVKNPGWATWHGPYIEAGNNGEFSKDAWGVAYDYDGTTITSSGSGTKITRVITASAGALTSNNVQGTVRDANLNLPGVGFAASLRVQLSHPNGLGGITTALTAVDANGYFNLSGVPIGNHTLMAIYTPANDTLDIPITVCPGRDVSLDIVFPSDLW